MNEAHGNATTAISPRQIALAYDRVVSAYWRGEAGAASVGAWFEGHWSDQAPPEPDDSPEGTSVLGASGSGIRWYADDEAIIGYVSRRPEGYYRIQINEAVPLLKDSWDTETRQLDADHLLGHIGASPVLEHPRSTEATSELHDRHVAREERDRHTFMEAELDKQKFGDSEEFEVPSPRCEEMQIALHVLTESVGDTSPGVPAGH